MANRRKPRRGILLLVCLILLVLFLLLGITFVLLSGSVRKGAKSYQRSHEHRDNSPQLMDAVLMDLIRGGTDSKSPFYHSNLLADVYGQPALRGRIVDNGEHAAVPNSVIEQANGQLTELYIEQDKGFTLSPVRGYYNGLVLTMVSGGARNQSARIVDYFYESASGFGAFLVVSLPGTVGDDGQPGAAGVDDDGQNGTDNIGELGWIGSDDGPRVNDIVLVNGRPFSGIGDPTKTPNRMFVGNSTPALSGGNEEYDAPDYNNPWLAVVLPGAHLGTHIKPSFHDPKLIEHAAGASLTVPADNIYRQVSFRPIPNDHPSFTGSNPSFNPFTGPWDVDNDGDGVPDSIWMDVGLPTQTLPDGRVVKPLVAMLIRDMDGRLSLNAHGNLVQLTAAYASLFDPQPFAGTNGAQALDFSRGHGYGAAEINLGWALGDPNDGTDAGLFTQYANLLVGTTIAGTAWPGRYVGSGETVGWGNAQPGGLVNNDLMSRIRMVHAYGASSGVFLAPHDFAGDGAVALDYRGSPMYLSMGGTAEFTDDPYEFNLNDASAVPYDAPFSVKELELLLRPTDIDAGTLPRRVLALAPRLAGFRDFVTTDSWDMPIAPVAAPKETRSSAGVSINHFTDLIRARIIDDEPATTQAQADTIINGLLGAAAPNTGLPAVGYELLAGLPWNLNRPIGNGWDDNGNLLFDEPFDAWTDANTNNVIDNGEFQNEYVYDAGIETAVAGLLASWPVAARTQYDDIKYDHNQSGVAGVNGNADYYLDANDFKARFLYAKQLYVLLMLMSDNESYDQVLDHTIDTEIDDPAVDPTDAKAIFARRMAQFAVNAIDFRDQDGIMTAFEYDINPFNGWTTDGDLRTTGESERGVVWGCEAPVAVLTEILALHNRRVKDEPRDLNNIDLVTINDPHALATPAPDDDILHYDSPALPVGSLFLEILCVARSNPGPDGDYGTADDTGALGTPELFTGGKLDLARVPNGGTEPVWRVAISVPHLDDVATDPSAPASVHLAAKPYSTTMDPGQFNALDAAATIDIERYVWFTATPPPAADEHTVFYNQTAEANAQLFPGEYLVVGPRPTTVISHVDNTAGVERQMIQLNVANPVDVYEPTPVGTLDYANPADIKAPKAIVCAAATPGDPVAWNGVSAPDRVGLNVSEPLGGADYYPVPHIQGDLIIGPALPGVVDYFYKDPTIPMTPTRLAFDIPLDFPGGNTPRADTPVADIVSHPDWGGGTDSSGTVNNYRTAFLQRLANPSLPWNPPVGDPDHDAAWPINPYITVDWMPIDLTVFNRDAAAALDPNGGTFSGSTISLRSRERGFGDNLYDIWKPRTADLAATPSAGTSHAYPYDLEHSLGFLNNAFDDDADADGNPRTAPPYLTAAGQQGDPKRPFPWITWNDRPFVSEFELLQVPASSPGMLTFEFEMPEGQLPASINSYGTYNGFPFGHLLNFFHTGTSAGDGAQLGRVFDYLNVQSLFTGTQTVFNPTVFSDPAQGVGPLRPPFNSWPTFREPGKININTIFHPAIWAAITNPKPGADGEWGDAGVDDDGDGITDNLTEAGFDGSDDIVSGPAWQDLVEIRRGYLPSAAYHTRDVLAYQDAGSTAAPSFFAMPFRAAANGDRVATAITSGAVNDVDTTLLRSFSTFGNPLTGVAFSDRIHDADPTEESLYDSTLRNSHFRYRSISRLGNLLTTRSNVYAVWMTIGYFEVTPVPVDAGHPDGFALGREVGEQTGDIRRHRAFYILDRTIPVGYDNGQDLNAEDIVRLRTHIE